MCSLKQLTNYPLDTHFMRTDYSNNPIVKKCIEFSIKIIQYCDTLEQKKQYTIARQLLRSATSIGVNVMEAQSAESKADFIHKLKVADKEAFETYYWMILCKESEHYELPQNLLDLLDEIMRLLNSIIHSAKSKPYY